MDPADPGADPFDSWALVQAAGVPACLLDRRLRYRAVTAAWPERGIGDPLAVGAAAPFEGRAFLDDVPLERRERWAGALDAILGGRLGQFLDDEEERHPAAARARVVTVAGPQAGPNGRIVGAVCARFDLTDAERVAANERELLGVLVAARQLQHFLGNQLALTLGYVELLTLDPRLPRELRERVDEALRGVVEATETLTKLRLLTRRELAPDDPSLSDLH